MKILFMCVANAARSQMAEGLAKHYLDSSTEIFSAGSMPKTVHPLAIEVLAELNIDITKNFSKSCDELPVEFSKNLDYLVTLCADEVCPVGQFQAAKRLHWPLKDPADSSVSHADQVQAFRSIRDEIKKQLLVLAEEVR